MRFVCWRKKHSGTGSCYRSVAVGAVVVGELSSHGGARVRLKSLYIRRRLISSCVRPPSMASSGGANDKSFRSLNAALRSPSSWTVRCDQRDAFGLSGAAVQSSALDRKGSEPPLDRRRTISSHHADLHADCCPSKVTTVRRRMPS